MFGGLEIKAPASEQTQPEPQESVQSAFSFISNNINSDEKPDTDATIPETNTPTNFCLSELLSLGPVQNTKNEEEKESGFTFLNKEEISSDVPQQSGFSFMSRSSEVKEDVPPPPPAQSGFSFMAPTVTDTPNPPVSSFSTAQISPAIKPKHIKKTRRGKKIGYDAQDIPDTTPYIPPVSNIPPVVEPSYEEEDAKIKSEEACKRAEQFLSEKIKEEYTRTPIDTDKQTSYESSSISPTVAAAEAAAEEAKAMKISGSRFTDGMAGFFAKTRKNFSFKKTDEKQSHNSNQWTSESVHSYSSNSEQSSQRYEEEDDDYDAKAVAIAEERRLQRLRQEAEEVERKAKEKKLHAKMKEEELKKLEEENRRREEERIRNMTPKEKFRVIINEFRIEIDALMLEIEKLRKQRKELTIEKNKTTQKDKLASQFLSQTYQKQTAAIDAEDFDLADHLTSIINQKTQQKKELTEILYQLKEASNELECNEAKALQKIIESFVGIKDKMEEFYEIEDGREKGDSTDQLEKFAETFKRLSAEQDRLNNELKHIERDEGIVKEERKELEDTIHAETKDIEAERGITNDKLSSVQDEIECLKEQLAIKEAEEKILQNELSNHNNEIEKIRSKFSRQLTRLSKKETSIADNRHDWETEKEAMVLTREKHEAEVTAHSEALLAYENLMKGVKSEIEVVGRWKEIISAEIKITLNSDEHDDEEELLLLTSDLVKCQAAVQDAEEIVTAAQHMLDTLYEEKDSIETSIPILENLKKTAAAKRDFKAASKASKEMKEAVLKLKQCEEEIETKAKGSLEDALAEKDRLVEDLKLKESLCLEKERSQAVGRMKQLGSHIATLEQFRDGFSKDEDEQSSDNTVSISSVGLNILEKEIEALKTEGELLGSKYGGWEEIVKGGMSDDNNNVSDDNNDLSDDNNDVVSSEEQQSDETPDVNETENKDEATEEPTENDIEEKTKEEMEEELNQLQEELSELENKLEQAVEDEDFDAAAEIDDSINVLKTDIEKLEEKLK